MTTPPINHMYKLFKNVCLCMRFKNYSKAFSYEELGEMIDFLRKLQIEAYENGIREEKNLELIQLNQVLLKGKE